MLSNICPAFSIESSSTGASSIEVGDLILTVSNGLVRTVVLVRASLRPSPTSWSFRDDWFQGALTATKGFFAAVVEVTGVRDLRGIDAFVVGGPRFLVSGDSRLGSATEIDEGSATAFDEVSATGLDEGSVGSWKLRGSSISGVCAYSGSREAGGRGLLSDLSGTWRSVGWSE